MAEILLSLTIIGVVAAITLPSLMGNINERVWNTQRKALYARFSQAIALVPNLNGYGTYSGSNSNGSVTVTADTAAEAFVTDGLSKVLKINNICDNEHLSDCGIPTNVTGLGGVTKAFPKKMSDLNRAFLEKGPLTHVNTKAVAFETQNGESVAVFYNPLCQVDLQESTQYSVQPKMCANFIYDLNGNRGPNAVGKDIGFITALYPTDTVVVAPMPLSSDVNNKSLSTTQDLTDYFHYVNAARACTSVDADSRLPNLAELNAIFYNRDFLDMTDSYCYWSSSPYKDRIWHLYFSIGTAAHSSKTGFGVNVRCIKR